MGMIKSVCVFCGSSTGVSECYSQAAKTLGEVLSQEEIDLVYGGSNVGLMGIVARTMINHGRHVTGIIPSALHRIVEPLDITKLIIVDTMHQRKAAMYERSDAFIALAGGIGTLEEFMETFTWQQLGYLQKPIALLNTNGYYDLLIKQLEHNIAAGFMKQANLDDLIISDDPRELIDAFHSYTYTYRAK